jgi:hypothetical protein
VKYRTNGDTHDIEANAEIDTVAEIGTLTWFIAAESLVGQITNLLNTGIKILEGLNIGARSLSIACSTAERRVAQKCIGGVRVSNRPCATECYMSA